MHVLEEDEECLPDQLEVPTGQGWIHLRNKEIRKSLSPASNVQLQKFAVDTWPNNQESGNIDGAQNDHLYINLKHGLNQ